MRNNLELSKGTDEKKTPDTLNTLLDENYLFCETNIMFC